MVILREQTAQGEILANHDPVSHPLHYLQHPSGIETIEITEHETFLRGNILKYVLRAPYKDRELQDLKKAQWYLAREISRVEEQTPKGGDHQSARSG